MACAWDAAVAVSLVRSLRAHAGAAAAVACGATACLGLVAVDVVRLDPNDAKPGLPGALVGMAVSFVCVARRAARTPADARRVLCWNDCAWALWGWWWMRRHGMTARDVYRRPAG